MTGESSWEKPGIVVPPTPINKWVERITAAKRAGLPQFVLEKLLEKPREQGHDINQLISIAGGSNNDDASTYEVEVDDDEEYTIDF